MRKAEDNFDKSDIMHEQEVPKSTECTYPVYCTTHVHVWVACTKLFKFCVGLTLSSDRE